MGATERCSVAGEKDGVKSHLQGQAPGPKNKELSEDISREIRCGRSKRAPILLAWCVRPASHPPCPPSVGCLALASQRYGCAVTAGIEEEVDSATQKLLPGAWAAPWLSGWGQ